MPTSTKPIRELDPYDIVRVGGRWLEVQTCSSNGDGTYSLGLEGCPPVDWSGATVLEYRPYRPPIPHGVVIPNGSAARPVFGA